jgi:hypothetical protein
VRPFRSYQFTSNVQSWDFGSTSSPVYILRFPGYAYDCNGNGNPDPNDVSSHASADCDGDFVPDECQDCNQNGIGDACDLLAGTSLDTNGNGIPDECDADVTPPQPSPLSFLSPPTGLDTSSITMSCVTATDPRSPPVEYFFDYESGQGGHDSGWQTSTQYSDTGLMPNSFYNYRVKARDSALPISNETGYSPTVLGATPIETPMGVSFSNVTPTSLTVSADGAFTNPGFGVTGFYFEMTPAAGPGANAWVSGTSVNINGLTASVNYTFRAKARNFQGTETPYTPPASIIPGGCKTLGDMNASSAVDGDDIAGFVRTKLGVPVVEDHVECADFSSGTLEGDIDALVTVLIQ